MVGHEIQGHEGLRLRQLGLDDLSRPGSSRLSFQNRLGLPSLLRSFEFESPGLDTRDVVLLTTRPAHVLDPDMNTLVQQLAPNLFGQNDADGVLVHVEHNPSATVVDVVGHTLLDSGIHLNINVVTDVVGGLSSFWYLVFSLLAFSHALLVIGFRSNLSSRLLLYSNLSPVLAKLSR